MRNYIFLFFKIIWKICVYKIEIQSVITCYIHTSTCTKIRMYECRQYKEYSQYHTNKWNTFSNWIIHITTHLNYHISVIYWHQNHHLTTVPTMMLHNKPSHYIMLFHTHPYMRLMEMARTRVFLKKKMNFVKSNIMKFNTILQNWIIMKIIWCGLQFFVMKIPFLYIVVIVVGELILNYRLWFNKHYFFFQCLRIENAITFLILHR